MQCFSHNTLSTLGFILIYFLLQAIPKQKIRIKLRSFWVPQIEEATKLIVDAARSTETKMMGPIPIPTKRRVYCVLRSPHVNKDSREHFEIRTHQRLIELENPNADTIDSLMQLDIPAGVDVEVKLLQEENQYNKQDSIFGQDHQQSYSPCCNMPNIYAHNWNALRCHLLVTPKSTKIFLLCTLNGV